MKLCSSQCLFALPQCQNAPLLCVIGLMMTISFHSCYTWIVYQQSECLFTDLLVLYTIEISL